jgi:hypothetical protein
MSIDMYSEKVADASALIREFAKCEYFEFFARNPEEAIKAFIAMQDAAEAKSAARIAELDAQLGKRPCQNNRCTNLVAANTRIAELEAQVSALKAAGGVPPGYALVPIEPTEEMHRAGLYAKLGCGERAFGRQKIHSYDDTEAVFKSMLAAAPQAAEQPKQQEQQQ